MMPRSCQTPNRPAPRHCSQSSASTATTPHPIARAVAMHRLSRVDFTRVIMPYCARSGDAASAARWLSTSARVLTIRRGDCVSRPGPDQLRMMPPCCHPRLSRDAQVAARCLHRSLLIRQPGFRADGKQRVGSSVTSDSVSWTVTKTCTTATKTRRVRPHAKMSLQANRLFTTPACIAGVRVSRPNRNALCGRMKL